MRSDIVIIILGMAAVTFLTRFGAQLAFRGTGILTALIVPALLLPQGRFDLTWHNPYLLAGLVAALVAWRFASVPVTMGVGMATILLLRLW